MNVLDKNEMDSVFKAMWSGMKAALIANDIQTAVSYFVAQSQTQYSVIFTALGSNAITMAQGMQNISMIYLKEGVAKYRIRRTESAGEITYYIYFGQDENGQWKILQF